MTGFLVLAGLVLLGIVILILLSGIRAIPNTRIGTVEKRFNPKGSVKSGFIALNGEAGFQPNVLRGGLHYLTPIQYVVPRVLVGGNKENGSGNIMEALLTMLLSDRFSALANKEQSQRSEEAEKLRTDIRNSMKGKKE
jgi:hypothetical protein